MCFHPINKYKPLAENDILLNNERIIKFPADGTDV